MAAVTEFKRWLDTLRLLSVLINRSSTQTCAKGVPETPPGLCLWLNTKAHKQMFLLLPFRTVLYAQFMPINILISEGFRMSYVQLVKFNIVSRKNMPPWTVHSKYHNWRNNGVLSTDKSQR